MDWLAPCALLAVFAHQRWRVRTLRQTVWKGGGFGMFADIRRVIVRATLWVDGDGGDMVRLAVEPPGVFSRVSTVPTVANRRRWATELYRTTWQRCGDYAHPLNRAIDVCPLAVRQITVHLSTIDFDARACAYTAAEDPPMTVMPSGDVAAGGR